MKIRNGFVSNSSSEAFICNTKKTPEKITEELKELLRVHNKMTGGNDSFDEVFDDVGLATESDVGYLGNWLDADKEYGVYSRFHGNDVKGKLIIRSASDNTIPYSLFELIEEAYDAYRIHLG